MRRTREFFPLSLNRQPAPIEVFTAMCRDASEELGCDLVSVWLFDQAKERITCAAAFDAATQAITAGEVLLRREYSVYFNRLLEETFIKAPDARNDRWTRELARAYFEPRDIQSLLDYILHDGAVPLGVICCESRVPVEAWTQAQTQYLLKLTALAASYFARRRE